MKNNFNIFLIDPSGSNLVRLTDGANSSENPVFSPDALHLAYSGNQTGKYRIYVMTAKGERAKPISRPTWATASSRLGRLGCRRPEAVA